jgi:AAA+ ATPase superfamily predicted ATPase
MFSEPAIGEKFFGRQEVLNLLEKRVSALRDGYRQNIALTGQSLSGKSSIIHHFLSMARDDDFLPIYVEVRAEEFKSFADKFIATLLHNALRKTGHAADMDIDSLIGSAAGLFPKTILAIKHLYSIMNRQQLDEAYSALLGLTSVLKDETGLSCVVILDEFDNLERLGIRNPFLSFGKVIMVQKDTMYIISSSRDNAIRRILQEKLSLLFGNFEIIRIAGFDPVTSKGYLDTKLAGFEMEDAVRRFVIAFTGGNPFYLDRMAARMKEIAAGRMTGYVDTAVVAEAIVDLVYNSSGAVHQYLTNFILELVDTRSRESCLSVLLAMANGYKRQNDMARYLRIKQTVASKILGSLAEAGMISKNGVFHIIDDVMLGFWLKHVYQRRRNMLVDGVFDRASLFFVEARAYAENFMRQLETGHAARLVELFSSFLNDLVQIDSKNIRLPHFTRVDLKFFADSTQYISASFRGKTWLVQPHERRVAENDIIDFIRNVKGLENRVVHKIVIPLNGMDENAMLLAKELRISIWDIATVNALMEIYGRAKIIII